MRTISIPEARKYCKENKWHLSWYKRNYADKRYDYYVCAMKRQKNKILPLRVEAMHYSRQYAIQAVYEAVKMFETITLKNPSAYIKRTKTRPTRRAKEPNII